MAPSETWSEHQVLSYGGGGGAATVSAPTSHYENLVGVGGFHSDPSQVAPSFCLTTTTSSSKNSLPAGPDTSQALSEENAPCSGLLAVARAGSGMSQKAPSDYKLWDGG